MHSLPLVLSTIYWPPSIRQIFLFAGNTAPGFFKMIENSNDFYVWRNLLPVLWKRGKQSKYLWHYKQIFFIFRLWLKANISQVGLIKKSPKELSALETLKRWWWHWLHYTSSRNSQKNQKIKSPFWEESIFSVGHCFNIITDNSSYLIFNVLRATLLSFHWFSFIILN